MAGHSKKDETMTVSVSNIKAAHNGAVISGQVARAVAEARIAAGYSIEDLAVTTGLVHDEILGVEDGSNADPGKVRRIAAALKIPSSAFLVA
jgi:ribosome-binding protein aMBF1 (putative translation factor)